MPRKPQARYWKSRKVFYCQINRKRRYLGKDKRFAERKFHEIMAARPEPSTSASSCQFLLNLSIS